MSQTDSQQLAPPFTVGGTNLFVFEAARVLRRPGPAPAGWARTAALIISAVVVAAAVISFAGWATRRDPGRYFGEQRPGTLLSAGLLISSADTCRRIHALPAAAAFGRFWVAHSILFAYLAVDELFRVHERIDRYSHRWLGFDHRHPITDHLDDLILIAYAAFAAALWYRSRQRLLGLPWTVLTMIAGFTVFAAMMALDVAAEIKSVEDSLKLVAGALILCAFLAARRELDGTPGKSVAAGAAADPASRVWPRPRTDIQERPSG